MHPPLFQWIELLSDLFLWLLSLTQCMSIMFFILVSLHLTSGNYISFFFQISLVVVFFLTGSYSLIMSENLCCLLIFQHLLK